MARALSAAKKENTLCANTQENKRQSGRHVVGSRTLAASLAARLAEVELAGGQQELAAATATRSEMGMLAADVAAEVHLAAAAALRSEMGTQTPITYVIRSGPVYVREYHPSHAPPPIADAMLEVDYYVDMACVSRLFLRERKLTFV